MDSDLQNAINASLGLPATGYGVPTAPTPSLPSGQIQAVVISESDLLEHQAGQNYTSQYTLRPDIRVKLVNYAPVGYISSYSTTPSYTYASLQPYKYNTLTQRPQYSTSYTPTPTTTASAGGPRKSCPICQEDFPASQCARLLPCHHDEFYVACIRSLCAASAVKKCPLCRVAFTQYQTPGGVVNAL